MANIQFLDLGNCRHWAQIGMRESVTGVNREAQLCADSRRFAQRVEAAGVVRMIGVFPGVQFDRFGPDEMRHANGLEVWSYKEARPNSRLAQRSDSPFDARPMSDYIEATLGRYLFPPLRNQRYLIRMDGYCDGDHLIGAGELQVEIGADRRPEDADVRILDVAPVFAQVRRNAVGARIFADESRLRGVWLVSASRLSQSGDVIDIHIKTLVACSHVRPEYNLVTMKKLLLPFIVAGAVACHTAPPSTTPGVDNSPGASTSVGAVDRFFAAVHAQNLQAMSAVWGTEKGPARDNMERGQLEKREVILQCYFNYDTFRVTGESPTSESRRIVRVELQRAGRTRYPTVYTVKGPGGRWFVENLDIAAVKDFCAMAPIAPGS